MTESAGGHGRPDDNIIPLRPETSSKGWGQREQEALTIARLAAMPQLEYERARISAAKKLRCRVSWLDRTIRDIRDRAARHPAWIPRAKGDYRIGDPITVRTRGDESLTLGFIVAIVHRHGGDQIFIVLADGNATTTWVTPASSEEPTR